MRATHDWFASEAAWWLPRVADHLWQATLFALVVVAASLALKHAPARLRHSLWLLASAKFIVPAALFVVLAEQAGDASSWFLSDLLRTAQNAFFLHGFTEPVTVIVNEFSVFATDPAGHNELHCALAGIWLTGSVILLAVWGMRRRRFLQALKRGRSMQFGREWEALKNARESLGMKRDVELVISSCKIEPTVCRIWNPVITLPESIAKHLDDVELNAIMLHELVHIQRRDNLIGNLQMAICAALWFHPLVWFISRKLYDEREHACDERVLEICAAPEAYAASILKVVRFTFGWKVAGVTGAASGTNLRRRIENIMTQNNTKRNAIGPRLLAGALLGLALVLMVVAGVNSRADTASEVAGRAVEGNEPVNTFAEGTAAFQKKAKPPLPPAPPQEPPSPQPAQKMNPAQPSQPAPASQPTNPSQESQPTHSAQPSQPDQPSAPPPPSSVSAPSAPPPPPPRKEPDQDKSSSKAQKEDNGEKQDKREVVKGELIEAPQPTYPDEAKEQKIEGVVTVSIVIDEEGKVISAKVASGHQLLHDASRDAAFKARFKPTTVSGKPAKVSGAMTYNFVLDKK
ncbi:MAG: M56 family metallopeptidase [Pyrinomonadaceae bacterium]